jgi:hypothetical protein
MARLLVAHARGTAPALITAVDDALAVDHDVGDAEGVAVWVLAGRAAGDPGRVEHRHV